GYLIVTELRMTKELHGSTMTAKVGVALLLAFPAGMTAQRPSAGVTAAAMRTLAHSYYEWRDSVYPVNSSGQGKHRWDDRLADYRMPAVTQRRQHVAALLTHVRAIDT